MTAPSVKLLPTIRRVALQISSIEECLASGDIEAALFLCKSMTQYLSNIQKLLKMKPSPKSSTNYNTLSGLKVIDD